LDDGIHWCLEESEEEGSYGWIEDEARCGNNGKVDADVGVSTMLFLYG